MNKELTPLEALKEIENFIVLTTYDRNIRHDECPNTRVWVKRNFNLDIIETALKDSEMEHTLRVRLENINYELVREKQANEKKLKALEIIKEKKVNINFLNNCISYGNYLLGSYPRDISKEEFDLLKEVLK